MVAIKNVFFLATAISAAVLPRDAAQSYSDLQTIDADTNKLTSSVNSWNGQLSGAFGIMSAEQQVEKDLDNADKNAQGQPTASSADSKKIVDYINNTLEPDVKKSLAAIDAKKSQFQAAGLKSTVCGNLNTLRNKTATLSKDLIADASSDEKSAGQAAATKLDNDFAAEQASFGC